MKKFEIGKTYACSSICDHECVWTFTVIRRTAKTVTFRDERGEEKTCRISADTSAYRNAETVFPLGRYSMAPMLDANKETISPEEAQRIEREEEERRTREIRERYEAEKAESEQVIKEARERFPLQDGAPYVVIEWSERAGIEEGLTLSVPAAEQIFSKLDQSRAERIERENSGGYDKTSFVIYYTDEDGQPSTYNGRYDLGDNDGGLIAHIRLYGVWMRDKGGCMKSFGDHKQRGAKIVALADQLDKLCKVMPGRVLSFTDARKRKQEETAAAGALAAEFLLDLISASAKSVPEKKPQPKQSGAIIPLF